MTTAQIREYINEEDVNVFDCRTRKSPLVLSGLFLEITRQFYSEQENLAKGISIYDPTGECPGAICIDSSYDWDPDNTDCRPSIIIDVGDLQYTTQNVQGIEGRFDYDLEEGEAIYCRLVTGSVVFAHLAGTKGEAINYASNTFDLYDGFSDVIKNDFCFEKFDLRSILRPRLRKQDPRDFECLVQADFTFQEMFSVKQESPKLKQVAVKVNSSLEQIFRMVK